MSDGNQTEPMSVAQELARLGEPDLDPRELDADTTAPVVADVEQLVDVVAIVESPAPTLSSWQRHRAWRKIAAAWGPSRRKNERPKQLRVNGSAVVALATVAASAILVIGAVNNEGQRGPSKRAHLEALAEQARASLRALPEATGPTRAQRLAEAHARRLEAQGGAGKESP